MAFLLLTCNALNLVQLLQPSWIIIILIMQQTTTIRSDVLTNEDDLELLKVDLDLDQRYFINTAQSKFLSIVMVAKSNLPLHLSVHLFWRRDSQLACNNSQHLLTTIHDSTN